MARAKSRGKAAATSGTSIPANRSSPRAHEANAGAPPTTVEPPKRSFDGWSLWLWLLPVVAFLSVAVALHQSRPKPAPDGPQGGMLGCRQLPAWIGKHARTAGAALSTSHDRIMGLALLDTGQAPYRHPSWSAAGNLGPMIFDQRGNVFVAPVPKVNVLDNRPAEQNRIWRVDASSEQLEPWLDLPAAAPANVTNPFGLLGLTYDCETDLLYASSVQGSTRDQELGEIHVLSAQTPTAVSRHALGDFMGLAVFRGRSGKRLYAARARSSDVVSFALDAEGKVLGDARAEFSLAGLGPRGDDVARRMTPNGSTQLTVYGVEFAYNLVAPTEKKQTVYQYDYQPELDRFVLRQIGQFPVSDPSQSSPPQ